MRRQKLNTLIRKAIAGDAVSLEELCRHYAKSILFQTRLLVKNKDDAEDVAQKVAITMLRDIRKLRSPYAFRSWLQRLIVNVCSKHNAHTQREARRLGQLSLAETVVDESAEARPEETVVSRDMQRFVSGYLERLSTAQAVALTLHYYEQLSYKEVAEALGVSVGTVSSTISKAKQNLKKMLKENGERDVLGAVFLAPFLRDSIKRTVIDEIEHGVTSGAVERFMSICKVNITSVATGMGGTVVAMGTWKTVAAISAALLLLGSLGTGALLMNNTSPEEAPAGEQVIVPVPMPDTRLTYRVAGEKTEGNPINPLAVQFLLLGGETVEQWVLHDVDGTEIISGTGGAIRVPDLSEAAGKGIIGDSYIDIQALNLADGDYVMSWYLADGQDHKTRAYWGFTVITPLPDAAGAPPAPAAVP